MICCHSDAAFANVGTHTQAGYIVGFAEKKLHHGEISNWTPVVWKSYKMPRAVSSTLGGESQAMSTATGTVEWLSLLLAEALEGRFNVRECRSLLAKRPPIFATDCKSLYDHLVSPSSPTAVRWQKNKYRYCHHSWIYQANSCTSEMASNQSHDCRWTY